MISADMISAVKVQFIQPIVEDDFVEKGMTAWLTDVEWDEKYKCYKLYFDFTEFEDINLKYFKNVYHSNVHTRELELELKQYGRTLFTAHEAGMYSAKTDTYFSCFDDSTMRDSEVRNDEAFARDILKYLREVTE